MATRKTPRSRPTSSRTTTTRTRKAGKRAAGTRRSGRPAGKAAGTGLTWGDDADAGKQVPMRTVTPNLLPTDCAAALDWYAKVFGAKELARMPGPGGKIMHAMTQIGDTVIMLNDNFGPPIEPQQACAFLHIHDKAIQRFWDRAEDAGATVVMPLANQFWGDRYGQLRDPFGITWSLGWPAKLTAAEKKRLEREAMQQMERQVQV